MTRPMPSATFADVSLLYGSFFFQRKNLQKMIKRNIKFLVIYKDDDDRTIKILNRIKDFCCCCCCHRKWLTRRRSIRVASAVDPGGPQRLAAFLGIASGAGRRDAFATGAVAVAHRGRRRTGHLRSNLKKKKGTLQSCTSSSNSPRQSSY